ALFSSQDARVINVTSKFYPYGAPEEIIDIWDDEMGRSHKDHHRRFVNSAIDIAVDQIRQELQHVRRSGMYRMPANKLTEAGIESRLDGNFLDSYASTADHLMRLLMGLTGETKTKSQLKGVRDEAKGDDCDREWTDYYSDSEDEDMPKPKL
ncbi:hypothetical protein BGZ59_005129, partial [Podila verticillata]